MGILATGLEGLLFVRLERSWCLIISVISTPGIRSTVLLVTFIANTVHRRQDRLPFTDAAYGPDLNQASLYCRLWYAKTRLCAQGCNAGESAVPDGQ
jgi:hypothetical protein